MYKGRTKFVATKGDYILTFSLAMGFLLATYAMYFQEGLGWATTAFLLFSLIGIGAVVETFTSFVYLEENELRLRRSFNSFIVKRTDIDTVSNEKGCPVFLILHNKEKIEIPSIGKKGVANSIRAWLRATIK